MADEKRTGTSAGGGVTPHMVDDDDVIEQAKTAHGFEADDQDVGDAEREADAAGGAHKRESESPPDPKLEKR